MAYNDIVISRISTGAPITQDLMTDLRDNPIGIANGDSGAPRIQKEAISNTGLQAGPNVILRYNFTTPSGFNTGGVWITYKSFVARFTGTINIKMDIDTTLDDGTAQARVLVDGVLAGTVLSAPNEDATGATESIDVTAGQTVEVQYAQFGGARSFASINWRFGVSDQDCVSKGLMFIEETI